MRRRDDQPFFLNRREAGCRLALKLSAYAGKDVLILGLPRGGVAVALEVARVLGAPLDVLAVRKIGVPGREELALGAVAVGGVRVIDRRMAGDLGVSERLLGEAVERETREVRRRENLYRQGRPPLDMRERTVVLVDDGFATGATARAAALAARRMGAVQVVVAAPVAPAGAAARLWGAADRVVFAASSPFDSVSRAYGDFPQLTDAEVLDMIRQPVG